MDKFKSARFAMLKKMSSKKSSEMHEPTVGESLKKKKASSAPAKEEEAEAPLSKAQQILKAKLGEKLGLETDDQPEEEMEQEEEEYEEEEGHDVKACPVKDCPLCNAAVSEDKGESEEEEAGEEEQQ